MNHNFFIIKSKHKKKICFGLQFKNKNEITEKKCKYCKFSFSSPQIGTNNCAHILF
jgi:hypothetical protein